MAEKKQQNKEQPHDAVPVSEGADAAENKTYKDNPDKPDPTSIAQVEVLPEDK